jgi:hypothetical protein
MKRENLRSAAISTAFTAGFTFFSGVSASGICTSTTTALSVVFGLCVLHVNIVAAFIVVIIASSQTLDLEADIDFFTSKDVVDDFTVALVS